MKHEFEVHVRGWRENSLVAWCKSLDEAILHVEQEYADHDDVYVLEVQSWVDAEGWEVRRSRKVWSQGAET